MIKIQKSLNYNANLSYCNKGAALTYYNAMKKQSVTFALRGHDHPEDSIISLIIFHQHADTHQ